MDLEIVIMSEVSQTEKEKCHMTSLICGMEKKMIQMNLLTKQKETHRLREWNYGCPWLKARGRDSWGVWDGHVQAARFKMDNQERPTPQYMELCSILYGSLDGRGFFFFFEGMGNGYMYMHGWVPHCTSEAITTLLIGHIPIQNKKLKD